MTESAVSLVLTIFLIFCRVASCLMVLPGFSSRHVPPQIRLLIALACTLALVPPLSGQLISVVAKSSFLDMVKLILSEVAVGLMIGTAGRIFFMALEFVAVAMSSLIGYGGLPGAPVEGESGTTLDSMIAITATVLIFLTDLHHEVFRALVGSYQVIQVPSYIFETGAALKQLVTVSSKAFSLAVQVASPFFLYSIVVNLLFGLANKLLPQVPIYFVSIPFVIAGGLMILILVMPEFLTLFMQAFGRWLLEGSP